MYFLKRTCLIFLSLRDQKNHSNTEIYVSVIITETLISVDRSVYAVFGKSFRNFWSPMLFNSVLYYAF